LWNTGKSKKYPGILGIFYFFWYFLGRGLLEFVRIDAVPITQIACFVMAPIALICLVLYVLTKASTASFRKVNGAIVDGTLAQTEITSFDVKNYNAVVKMLKNSYFMWNLYKVKSLNIITLDASNITKKPKKEAKNG
ncbi:MAG: prolipoprotein diacylglyceryl transferase, partial [Clostridia bacterium]|nr:prolipoprotein diacylglyceryl transferase [Clostridia bacterium]